jgi:restriction endonuclease Mrr
LSIPAERAKPVEAAEEELRKKRAAIRHRSLLLLEKARQVAQSGDLITARKGYQDTIASYRAAGLEPEPDIWAEAESFNRRVAECVEVRRQRIEGLDGHEFEVQVARLYQAMGYSVRVTARNGGIDVWAFKEKRKVVIQCKRWKNPVGPGEIREFNGSQGRKVADEAVFVTSSTFTEQAEVEAAQAEIKLVNGAKLIELFAEFYVEAAS